MFDDRRSILSCYWGKRREEKQQQQRIAFLVTMVNSNRELVLVRNLRWLNKEKYSFSVHFIPFFPSTSFLLSKTRIHSASGGQEMLIRSEAFNQGDIYENEFEGTWGTRLFQCYFGLRGWQLIRDIPYFGGRFKETCTCHSPFFSIPY